MLRETENGMVLPGTGGKEMGSCLVGTRVSVVIFK